MQIQDDCVGYYCPEGYILCMACYLKDYWGNNGEEEIQSENADGYMCESCGEKLVA